jgi:Uncharacterised nucleotidyltransferase
VPATTPKCRRSSGEGVASFLRALGDPDPSALVQWLATEELHPDLAGWAIAQHVGPYLFHRLQRSGALENLPQGARTLLQTAYYQAAAANTIQRQELANVLGALEGVGVEVVLLKGTALAYTVYDDPISRLRGDIDAWLPSGRLPAAVTALEALGYCSRDKTDRPPALLSLVGGEQQMVSSIPGTGLIELQSPALRGEWTRHTTRVDHAGMWSRCLPIVIDGHKALVMAPEDALILLCHHQAISHQFSFPWGRGLLDLHLVVGVASPNWPEVVARARAWRLATVLWTVFCLARQLFDTPIPDEVLGALAPGPWRQRAIHRLQLDQKLLEMRAADYHRRRFWIQLLLVDRIRDMMRLIWRGLFPEDAWLSARYGVGTPASLWRARLMHPWHLVTAGRA